jgi:16S rRNA processing protein RimM
MIKREDLVKIGQFKKPHGVKGEITFTFTDDSFEDSECPFFICEIDGIFVPFRIVDYRFTSGATGMVHLKNLNSDNKVRFLSNKEIYFPKKYLVTKALDDSYTWNYFVGFTLIDEHNGKIGKIADIDESTLNTLFVVETDAGEILVPAVEEIITSVDESTRNLYVKLPEGLLELS